MPEAIVIGGGIVGAATAYHLARDGVETLLVDRGDPGRATDAGAGIVSPATSGASRPEEWFEFAVEADRYYPDLIAALEEEQGGETGYARCGLLQVAVEAHDVEAFETARRRIRERRERFGYPDADALHEASPAEARERFPPLEEPRRALYYEGAARVDGSVLEGALRRAGAAHGLRIEDADVRRLRIEDGAVTGAVTDAGEREADVAVIAGGAWSQAFADQLSVPVAVEPQRGQIVHLDCSGTRTADWPIVSAFEHRYFVPWPDERVAVGATDEDGVGFAPHSTVAGVESLLDSVLRLAPGLRDAAIEEVRVGLRPVTDDGLPMLGPVPRVEGVYLATGHGPAGLQLGPYSGKIVADLAAGGAPEVDLSPFRPGRFVR